MRAIRASSTAGLPAEAVLDVGDALHAQGFAPSRASCALVFATTHLARDPPALSRALGDVLQVPFVGFVGASAFDGTALGERKPALSVLVLEEAGAAWARTTPLDGEPAHAAARLLADAPLGRTRFLAASAEPFEPSAFLGQLDEHGVPVLGALSTAPSGQRSAVLASGAAEAASSALLVVEGCRALTGVAQGARPIGPPREVTAARANLIEKLDGRPAFEALLRDLPAQLRTQLPRLGGSLFAGVGTEEGGAWLLRHVVGLDPQTGCVAVAGQPRVGAEVVFSLRDSRAARDELEETVSSLDAALEGRTPLAVVLFSCLGRDESFFGAPLHDVERVRAVARGAPVVGVATNGQLATFGPTTHLFGSSCVVSALLPDAASAR